MTKEELASPVSREVFERVWQRVTAGREGPTPEPVRPAPPPLRPEGEAAFLARRLAETEVCAGLCRGGLAGLRLCFVRQRQRLAATLYLHCGERPRREEPVWEPLGELERCRRLYLLCRQAQQAYRSAAGADTALAGLYRELESACGETARGLERYLEQRI